MKFSHPGAKTAIAIAASVAILQFSTAWAQSNTADAGATWKLADIPVQMASSWFRGVTILPDGRGFIVGSRGLVLATQGDKFTALRSNY